MTDKPRRGRPPKSRGDDLKNITIRIEVTDDELSLINLRTTPRQRALLLAGLAEAIKEIELKKVMEVADMLTGYGDHEPNGRETVETFGDSTE